MPRWMIERRLRDVSGRIKRMRRDLAATEEQLAYLESEAEDARIRALVSETPIADADAREAQRHADVQARHRDELRRTIEELVAEQDSLLDRMASSLDRS